jgi:hypothetical protein
MYVGEKNQQYLQVKIHAGRHGIVIQNKRNVPTNTVNKYISGMQSKKEVRGEIKTYTLSILNEVV